MPRQAAKGGEYRRGVEKGNGKCPSPIEANYGADENLGRILGEIFSRLIPASDSGKIRRAPATSGRSR